MNVTDHKGKMALHRAAQAGFLKITKILIERGSHHVAISAVALTCDAVRDFVRSGRIDQAKAAGGVCEAAKARRTGRRTRMFGTDDDPQMKKMGFVKKFAFDLNIKNNDEFSITTIYIDTRTKDEKLRPAFRHVFTRTDAEQ